LLATLWKKGKRRKKRKRKGKINKKKWKNKQI